jgi:hypothetical protein
MPRERPFRCNRAVHFYRASSIWTAPVSQGHWEYSGKIRVAMANATPLRRSSVRCRPSVPPLPRFAGGEGSCAPSPVRARPLRSRSLNSPSLRKPSFPQRLPDAAAPGRLCPPPLQHRLRECVPMRSLCAAPFSATGLWPRLTPAPTASRSAAGRRRGIAMEAPPRPPLHETRQQQLSRLVLPPPSKKCQPSLSLRE